LISDELDEAEMDFELDEYIEKIIKAIQLELTSHIYPNENNRNIDIEFDQNELQNQRPKTSSSWKGRSISKAQDDDEDNESVKMLSMDLDKDEIDNEKKNISKLSSKSSSKMEHGKESKLSSKSKTSVKKEENDLINKDTDSKNSFKSKTSSGNTFGSSSAISIKRSESKEEEARTSASSRATSFKNKKDESQKSKSASHSNEKKEHGIYSSESFCSSQAGSRTSIRNEPKIFEIDGEVDASKTITPVLAKNDPLLTEISINPENNEINQSVEVFKENEVVEVNDVKLQNSSTSTTDMHSSKIESKSVRNKKLQVNLSPKRRDKSKDKNRRHLSDSYQLFDESYLLEKDAAVQTSRNALFYESTPANEDMHKKLLNSIGIQAAYENEDKRLLKREKSRKRNLDYRRIFYYYHEELRKLQNAGPKIDKAIENHVNRIKSSNKQLIREEMFDDPHNKNIIIAPVMFSVANSAEYNPSSPSFYGPDDMGGYCTDSAKLSKIAYDVRKDEVRLRNRLIYGGSNKSANSQSFETKYLTPSRRQFLPFGTILKVPTLHLGHQKEKVSNEREREIVARLHDNRVNITQKKN
jgi:hypothetical protein